MENRVNQFYQYLNELGNVPAKNSSNFRIAGKILKFRQGCDWVELTNLDGGFKPYREVLAILHGVRFVDDRAIT